MCLEQLSLEKLNGLQVRDIPEILELLMTWATKVEVALEPACQGFYFGMSTDSRWHHDHEPMSSSLDLVVSSLSRRAIRLVSRSHTLVLGSSVCSWCTVQNQGPSQLLE